MHRIFSLAFGRLTLLAAALVLLHTAAHAQQAGDTTNVRCSPPQPAMFCVDLDGRASIDPAAGALTYRWLMGDGTTLTGPVISHCYKERKNYVVQLDVVVDATGEVRPGQKYIPVNLAKQDILDFMAPARVRVGETAAFAAPDAQLSACQSVRIIWDFRDGSGGQGRTAQHVYRRPGTYAVRFSMRGYGTDGCASSHCVTRDVVVTP